MNDINANGRITYMRSAAKKYRIPFNTLHERIKKGLLHLSKLGRKCDLPEVFEKEFAERVKLFSKIFSGLSPLQFRRAVCELKKKSN